MQEVKYILTIVKSGKVENHSHYDFLSAESARLQAKKDPATEAAFILPASVYDR
jgi:hypothetical protein